MPRTEPALAILLLIVILLIIVTAAYLPQWLS